MNLELLESFGQNYPEEFDGTLDCISIAVTCQFNKRGTLLAVGCNDGRIVIWDFLTRGMSKIISAQVHPVCSLSWSRDGFKLVSASTDNSACVWEVITGECIQRYKFPSPILKVQFNPRNEKLFLACPMRHAAVLVYADQEHQIVPLDEDNDVNIVASFDRRGDHVYTGNSKGKVLVYKVSDLTLVASFKVMLGTASTTSIKSIDFARRGDLARWLDTLHVDMRNAAVNPDMSGDEGSVSYGTNAEEKDEEQLRNLCFLINTADRVIRVYATKDVVDAGVDGEPEPVQKVQDLVNKTTWKKCCFSGDGEYICAGSARTHALYIWEKSIGNLVKILHGTKGEVLLDVVWHPVRPIIASISTGVVSIWAQNQVENWSAFAPDFKELDENVEYEERESEFDLEDEDKSVEANMQDMDEDLDIDVVTVEKVPAFCSSDEEEEDNSLQFLPVAPDIEDQDDGWQPAPPTESTETKIKSYEVKLDGPPCEETHPMLVQWRAKEKATGGKKPLKTRNEKRPSK